jgi:hypothetical protein
MKLLRHCVSLTALLALSHAVLAQDRTEIDTTKIIGNRELPKVLTIVPWKKPLPGALTGKPLKSVLDETLAPIDREVLGRQINYGAQVQVQTQIQAQARLQDKPANTAPPTDLPKNLPAPATGEQR